MAGSSVLIADDDPIVCSLIRKLLANPGEFQVVGQASDGKQAASMVESVHPDVLLLDLLMPNMNGLEVMRVIRTRFVPINVIVLAAAISSQQALEAFHLGARAVLEKRNVLLLSDCLACVQKGNYWFEGNCISNLEQVLERLTRQSLTPARSNSWNITRRELQIIQLAVTGHTNREIASVLNVRESTVKSHLAHIFEKCGITNRVELVQFARFSQLVQ